MTGCRGNAVTLEHRQLCDEVNDIEELVLAVSAHHSVIVSLA